MGDHIVKMPRVVPEVAVGLVGVLRAHLQREVLATRFRSYIHILAPDCQSEYGGREANLRCIWPSSKIAPYLYEPA